MAKTYLSGKKCNRGHTAPRRLDNKTCVKCAAIAEEKWRKKNSRRVRENANKKYPKYAKKAQERNYKWRIENREKFLLQARISFSTRRARLSSCGGRFTEKDINCIFKKQKGLCACCNKSIRGSFHIDHIKPISKGGSSWPKNIQLLTPSCNIRKGNK